MAKKSSGNDPGKTSEEFLKRAYGLDGLSDALEFYGACADDYDEQMEQGLGYLAPRMIAQCFAAHLADRTAAVLDIGCGTGLTSHYLAEHGFSVFDGIDITPEMIARARQRGIYRNLLHADITNPLDVPDATYGGAISSGTFTVGHVGSEPLDEIARVLRPGGILACSIHRDIWEPKGFAAKFAALNRQGILKQRDMIRGAFFEGHEESAMYCVFERT
ncbi:MAG: class I SAM-dependent methyltransferase [Alphaproteobacteria bacterium]|nr:class I SAM-dependent methyltransferase [Alphaproteobacteria bacterium]